MIVTISGIRTLISAIKTIGTGMNEEVYEKMQSLIMAELDRIIENMGDDDNDTGTTPATNTILPHSGKG